MESIRRNRSPEQSTCLIRSAQEEARRLASSCAERPLPVASTFIRSPARKGVVHTEAVMGRV